MASLDMRRERLLRSARERAGGEGGQTFRVRDHLARVEFALEDDYDDSWPDYDERRLDALEDEGIYLDGIEASREEPPGRYLAGFLTLRIGEALQRRARETTWEEIDQLTARLEELLGVLAPAPPAAVEAREEPPTATDSA